MSGRLVLAVDGGNSKTDLALLREDGAVLALVRGGISSPHHLGLDGTIALLEQLHADARARAGLDGDARADGRPPAARRARPAGRGASGCTPRSTARLGAIA